MKKRRNSVAESIRNRRTIRFVLGIILFCITILVLQFVYKKARFYYALYLTEERSENLTNTTFERNRIRRIITEYNDYTFGIDISHYQDFMVFDSLSLMNGTIDIDFVVMRATMGDDGVDRKFKMYWRQLDNHDFIRGAYHYYRPWEDPEAQAKSFLKNIDLKSGDLRPVLDIEKKSRNQSREELLKDLQIWLTWLKSIMMFDRSFTPIIISIKKIWKVNLMIIHFVM